MIETTTRPITEVDLARIDPERGASPVAALWARLMFAVFALLIVGGAIGAGIGLLHLRGGSPAWASPLMGVGVVACGAFALAMLYVTYHVVFPGSSTEGRLIKIGRETPVEVTRVVVDRAFLVEEDDGTPGLLVRSPCGRWVQARGGELVDAIRAGTDGSEHIGRRLTLEAVGGYLIGSASEGEPTTPLEPLDMRLDAVEDVVVYQPGELPVDITR